jgi:hypothetical protein
VQHVRGASGPLLGKFRVAAISGLVTGAAAGATLFSARFAPTTFVRAIISQLRLKSQIITPFTAPNEFTLAAYVARSFTASDSGGTAVLPTGLNNLLASISDSAISPLTNFTDIRVATTGGLTVGTRTLDANPILVLPAAQLAASPVSQSYNETDLEANSDQRFALNLQGQTGGTATNAEGIVVTSPIAQGAGGVVRFVFEIEWYEYATNSAEVIS